ncbi:MAG: SagB/ThcOx family dehydrogenase [Cyanobacteria bacterium SID2]|nr:SagB/ThcOx family dehydrogenase [Cyanobacteria bacterium SID2]MBP0004915.1 SagB/ThcOx family dehydrogenase [Cyanobacteria bacterium SBC]
MSEDRLSIARYYHERTKYHPETIGQNTPDIDWERPPVPFKDYKFGTSIDLKPDLKSEPPHDGWQRISRLLSYSYGITARLPTLNSSDILLRAAPSAGGLYPAEVYLVSRGTPELPVGLYNYQPRDRSLLKFWDSDLWKPLQAACFWHPALETSHVAVIVTAVFFRSAWRYQDRAYRRIHLDIGHLLGNLELTGALNDYRPHFIGGFCDAAVNECLYLNPDEEGAIAVVPLTDLRDRDLDRSSYPTALPSSTQIDYPDLADGDLLTYLHRASCIEKELPNPENRPTAPSLEDKYNFPFCTKISTATDAIDWGENLQGLETTLLKRRSTRTYNGAPLTFDRLKTLLDFTYHPEHYVRFGFNGNPDYFDIESVQTFVVVSAVEGLEAGCYYYAPKAQELRQIRFKNFRRELHFLCLGQDLGRDAAVTIFHTANLSAAVDRYGDRAYRYLHLDAGHLGQRANLAAIYLGFGASGIGGFFDDRVNDVLGIPEDEAVLYITTFGQPRI